MRLSCADYTWPLLPHTAVLDLVAAIGCDAVDLGFFTDGPHLKPAQIHGRVAAEGGRVRERVESRGLVVADVFAIPHGNFRTMSVNNPDPVEQQHSLDFFADAVTFAVVVGAPGLSTLPGVLFDGDTFEQALARSAEGLNRRVELAAAAGLALSVEPHTQSVIDTPDKTLQLLERVPGLTITLDYAHYVYGGVEQKDIDPVIPYARHLQCRPGRPGGLQVAVSEDAIDWSLVLQSLQMLDYQGFLALEYTWQEWMGCNRVDTVGESILLRDVLRKAATAAERLTA